MDIQGHLTSWIQNPNLGENEMNFHTELSRRTLIQRIAITGAAASAVTMMPRAFAQNGDTQLVCISDNVRVRSDHNLSASVLGTVSTGDIVNLTGTPVDADGYTWVPITVSGSSISGWAAGDYFVGAGESPGGWPGGTFVTVNSDNVNLRNAPGLSGAIIATYSQGTNATVLEGPASGNGYSWYRIEISNGTVGWMVSDFLTEGSNGGGWPAGTPVYVNSDGVRLRSDAGTGASVLGTYNANTNAVVTDGPLSANSYFWYQVSIQGQTGWMASEFLSEGSSGDGGGGEWAPGDDVMPGSDLNLRSGPGTGTSVIRTYGAGSAATVIRGPQAANGYEWYEVEVWDDGQVGWFAGQFLEAARFEPTGSRHRINDGPLNLRSSGSTSASIVSTLQTGTVVVIADASFTVNDGYTWMNVYVENNPSAIGWIAQGFSSEI